MLVKHEYWTMSQSRSAHDPALSGHWPTGDPGSSRQSPTGALIGTQSWGQLRTCTSKTTPGLLRSWHRRVHLSERWPQLAQEVVMQRRSDTVSYTTIRPEQRSATQGQPQ